MTPKDRWALGNLTFSRHSRAEVLEQVLTRVPADAPLRVVTPNIFHVHLARSNQMLARAVNEAQISIPDGWPVARALRFFHGDDRGRITGSDLAIDVIAEAQRRGLSVGLLGGSDFALRSAEANLRRSFPDLTLKSFATNPYLPTAPTAESLDEFVRVVNSETPDILLLCMGAPKSELHLSLAANRLQVQAALCVGATVDFFARTKARAPQLVQRFGLEWAFRLAQEPKRLASRYASSALSFASVVAADWLRQSGTDADGRTLVFVSAANGAWGAEHSLALIAKAGIAGGVDVRILCASKAAQNFFQQQGIPTAELVMSRGGRIRLLQAMRDHVVANYPDAHVVVFSSQFAPLGPLLRLSRAFTGETSIDIHDVPRGGLDMAAIKLCMPFTTRVIAISKYVASSFGLGTRASIIPRPIPGFDFEVPPPRTGLPATRIGIVGRVDPEKRIGLAIDTLSLLPDSVELLVYGEPFMGNEAYLESLVAHAEKVASGRVRFLGRREPREIYAAIDVLLVGNANEPSGRTVGEAMAAGVPVVAPSAGGSNEFFEPGASGLVYTAGDPQSAADQIRFLIENTEARAAMGQAGRTRVLSERNVAKTTTEYFAALGIPLDVPVVTEASASSEAREGRQIG